MSDDPAPWRVLDGAGVRSQSENPHVFWLLGRVNAALDLGHIEEAVRHMDRAWRQVTRDDAVLAKLYGTLLARVGHHEAALGPLEIASKLRPGPGIEALVIETLINSGRCDAAAKRLGSALRRFAADPRGDLAQTAHALIGRLGPGPAGWVGVAPTLDVVGGVVGVTLGSTVELRSADGQLTIPCALRYSGDTRAEFNVALPDVRLPTSFDLLMNGVPALGSGFAFAPDFAVDGRSTARAGVIEGWVSVGWNPSWPVDVRLEDESGNSLLTAATEMPTFPGRHQFRLDALKVGLTGEKIAISVRLPDATLHPFPDSPLLLGKEIRPRRAKASRRVERSAAAKASAWPAEKREVDVIVPVYLGREETLSCLEAVRMTCRDLAEIIVVDDASPDVTLRTALDRMAAAGTVTLLRNERNLGFPASVNRGLGLHGNRDAVILNSDAVVHSDWLRRLQRAAYSAIDIGTVTPLTNNGSICSYPRDGTHACSAAEAAKIDKMAANVNAGVTIDLPVGIGFCLYVRRDCLQEVGLFDAESFGRGYGEESDFCVRARQRGWRNLLAPNVFVQHAGARSFGSRQKALLDRSQRIINLRYPGYDRCIQEFLAEDPIQPARRRLDEKRCESLGATVILATHSLAGGVKRFVEDRARDLRNQGFVPLIIQPTATGCEIVGNENKLQDLHYRIPHELPALRRLLKRLRIDHVELHHFLQLDSRVVKSLLELSVPYDIYVHDYIWICPRISLTDGKGTYCGEPAAEVCEKCVKRNGSDLNESISVVQLRRRSRRWLESARNVVVPSSDVAVRVERYFPKVRPKVTAWEHDIVGQIQWSPSGDVIRVASIGGIGDHKGYEVLLKCAKDAARRELPLEFVVIGYTHDDEALLKTGKAFITGRYEDSEIPYLLRREKPHLAFFASVWPETWCFSLTHALRAGLPVIAFDLGAIAERLRRLGFGLLMPLNTKPAALNDRLLIEAAIRWPGIDAKAHLLRRDERSAFQRASPLMRS